MTVTKSFSVEFDDALLDLDGWKNPRYEGSKLTGQKINEYNNGDVTYGKNPVLTNKTVALYIGNTLIGGEDEDEQYAHIKKHSYVDINRILIINPKTDELTLLDATQEGFNSFHRFVTNDLPTGGSFNIRLLDYSIPNALSANTQNYVKMNKGWLLKSFKSGVYTGNNNGLVLFNSESILKFSYALDGVTGNNLDHHPTYLSASLHSNKFSDSYYSGSLALESGTDSNTTLEFISSSDFIDQSKEYLSNNLSTTELHLTLFRGSYDFAPGIYDERSISTFEVDKYMAADVFIKSGSCEVGISSIVTSYPFLHLKGQSGTKFWPTTSTDTDSFTSYYAYNDGSTCVPLHTVSTDANIYVRGNTVPTGSYSGSFSYELSWLDKSHTLITDIDKESSLPNGIGEKGFVIIPQQLDKRVKLNIDYYLSKAGLIDETFTKIT